MRTLQLLFLTFLISTIVQAQKLIIPKKPYVLVVGKYKFVSETVVEKSPDLSGGFSSANFGGIQMELPGDSTESEPIYINGDSLRTWTYLFEKDTFRISYPPKIDTVKVRDIISRKRYIRYDTTDHIMINKLADTISLAELKKLLYTEIQVFNGNKKLRVRRIGIRLVWANGKDFYTNYEKRTIAGYPTMGKDAMTLFPYGYLIIDSVWFYNLENEQDEMTGAIGWLIK